MKTYTIEIKTKKTTTTTTTKEITERQYNAMKEASSRLLHIMQEKGKASLTLEEKAKGFGALDEELQSVALKEATWAYKDRRRIEKLNAFMQEHITIRVPGTSAYYALTPVAYRTRQGSCLALEGIGIQAIALIGTNAKTDRLSCRIITKGNKVANELSVAYGRRCMKEYITDKLAKGLKAAIDDALASLTYDDILKTLIRNGKLKDARAVNEEIAEFKGWDYAEIRAEQKVLRTCKVTRKSDRLAG